MKRLLEWFRFRREERPDPRHEAGELLLIDTSRGPFDASPAGYDPVYEQYRLIRDQLLAIPLERRPRVLLLTSAEDAEGKSLSTYLLGRAIAERGDMRVLLVDANLREPELHLYAGAFQSPGLVECLRGSFVLDGCVQGTDVDQLEILASGELPGNPSELLGSDDARETLATLKECYDFVLLDSPSLQRFADTTALARFVDAILLVVHLNKTARTKVERSLGLLRQMGIQVLGCILTGDEERKRRGRYAPRAEESELVP